MKKKITEQRQLCLIYPFNPVTTVVANCERDLYIASLLGISKVKFYPIYRDLKVATVEKSFDVAEKLVTIALELGYEEALVHGFFRGFGFSPKIFSYNEELSMYDGCIDFLEYQERNSDILKDRESIGNRLIKSKNNVVC